MRLEDAAYGGVMSAHHYFREFAYGDGGMIPWLLVAALMSEIGKTLAELVEARMAAYSCSGGINHRLEDIGSVLERARGRVGSADWEGSPDRPRFSVIDTRLRVPPGFSLPPYPKRIAMPARRRLS